MKKKKKLKETENTPEQELCYYSEEETPDLGAEKERLLDLAYQAKRNAGNVLDSVLEFDAHTILELDENPPEKEEAAAELASAAEISEEAKAMLEKAYAEACAAVEHTEQMMGLHQQAYDEAVELVKKRSAVLAESEKMLQNAKDAASEIAKMGAIDQETKTERARRLNDGTMVTVVCIAYKHEEFIAQALDSFLMQKTNFKFKVFVGEDCGPDGTADIIRDYAQRYPDIIIPFIREKNMGAQRNLIDMCQSATSPYIAFCEGDDYWVDEYKLQKQFDYMEAHPNICACTTQTEILAPADWHLRSWYLTQPDGKILIPDSIPGYVRQETFNPGYIIDCNVAHTSTHFYRWNYDLEIPDWYYKGIIGDTPLLLLQLGSTPLGHIPEITSVYRINEGSIFFDKNRERNFLRTRKDYVRYLYGLRTYAVDHFKNYPVVALENRIKREAQNYLQLLVDRKDSESIAAFFAEFPGVDVIILQAYLSFYRDQCSLTQSLTWDGYQMTARNKYFRRILRPQVKLALSIKKNLSPKLRKVKQSLQKRRDIRLYWKNTRVKKDPNLWIFSGFNKKSYMDNTMYFYEYVLEHHPEINAVWLTGSEEIYRMLKGANKPVIMQGTAECRKLVSRASIAVTDHFKMSDYGVASGMNDRLNIVQLWHGVGLKAIGDLKNTNVPGVQFCDDILPAPGDSGLRRLIKKRRYHRLAPHRELFEKYFLLVCPGQERIDQVAKPWNIPLENCFVTGHPRNILLHQSEVNHDSVNVLYAPTYRWKVPEENFMVTQIVDNAEEIQAVMERLNGTLTIRLHPHTWRNYNRVLDDLADRYDRIVIDHEKDIYKTLGEYNVLISDYSSIAYDFILLDRPVVFFNYDFENFIRTECKLNYDYNTYSPGEKTKTWKETLTAIEAYINDPEKDGAWRRKVCDEFYDMSVNDADNSERIVQEIQRRLAASKNGKKVKK